MWDVLKRNPRGRISLRNLPLLATSLLVAVLVCIGASHTAFAADATRIPSGGFTYEGKNFTNKIVISANDPRKLGGEVTAFEYMSPNKDKVEYLYFAKGIDPDAVSSALYTTFDYQSPDRYSNQSPSPPAKVTIATATSAPSTNNSGQAAVSCGIENIGWIVCPVSNALAGFVDFVYGVITQFLEVRTSTINNDATYQMWNTIRVIANICFVIAFLIIIFSQVTSLGISAYGLRKMLPRLIIAAILVNLSYFICQLAIDLSNYLGYSVNNMFMSVYDSVKKTIPDNLNWGALSAEILAGGAVGGLLAGWGIATLGPSMIASLGLTIASGLITVAFAAIVALLVLAARQAILVVLTVLAPLAFVAMVLPSTEKWFEKWKNSFITLLVMFPLFAILFGGAQLAGWTIIAGGIASKSIIMIIMGMIVQVVPLAFTPFLVKMSTGVLGMVAGMINNPNKGPIDRLRNFTKDNADYLWKKGLGGDKKRNFTTRGMLQSLDAGKKRRDLGRKAFENEAERNAMSTVRYRGMYDRYRDSETSKSTADNNLKAAYDQSTFTNAARFQRNIEARQAELNASEQAKRIETMHTEIDAGAGQQHIDNLNIQNATYRGQLLTTADSIQATSARIALEGTRKSMAERKIVSDQADFLKSDAGATARAYAAGVMGEVGERSVIATAKSNASKFMLDDIKNIENTLDYDVSSNVNKLYEHFQNATTDAERVAYTSIMGKRGAPGAVKLRNILKDMDARFEAGEIDRERLNDFKELVLAQNSSIGGVGKDVEFYLTNAAYDPDYGDPGLAGKIKTFDEITNEVSTWSNLSADAFSRMNLVNQMQGLRILAHKNPAKFTSFVDSVLKSDSARANLKESVRLAMQNHSDPDSSYWYDDPDGYNIPSEKELTEFERHVIFETERPLSDFNDPRPGYEDKTPADWKAKYDKARAQTAAYMTKAEDRARNHGGRTFYS